MKRLLTTILIFSLAISLTGNAFALKFTGELGNQATFETLAEAHAKDGSTDAQCNAVSYSDAEGNLNEASQKMVTYWAKNNGIGLTSYDFDTYPQIGFGGDVRVTSTVNDEFEMVTTYLKNSKGEPRVAFSFVKGMIHALYPEYAFILWDFVKDYSRNLSTGEVIYQP